MDTRQRRVLRNVNAGTTQTTPLEQQTVETAGSGEPPHRANPPHAPEMRGRNRRTRRLTNLPPATRKGDEGMLKERVMPQRVTTDTVLLTFKEAMDFLRVSRSTLYRLMWSGQLRGHKVGSTWRFYESDLLDAIASPVRMTAGEDALLTGKGLE